MTDEVEVTPEVRSRLRELRSKATPGPYRAHDHNDMARLGEDPVKWLGYAWIGRITEQSEPDGRFDAGWLDRDSRGDACREYRERASGDAHFVAEALNALPRLLNYIDALEARLASQSLSSDIEAERLRAWADVQAERRRQIEAEGWTPAHDDEHDDAELLAAALCYGQSALGAASKPPFRLDEPPALWPWDVAWWKPANPRRDLVRAAALILAEIERIDRAAALKETPNVG